MKAAVLAITLALLSGPQEKAQIEGTVLRADGTAPVPGARILLRKDQSIRSENDYGTYSGSDGHFVIKDIEPGRYRLLVKQSGFIDGQYGQKRPNRPGSVLDISKGEQLLDLTVKMTAGAVVSGRVYDDEGHPLSNATVQLMQPRYQSDGRITPITVSTATTDDRGEYRVYWIPPGSYYMTSTVFERGPNSDIALNEQFDGNERVMLPTFYPNSFDDAHATPISVEPGAELRGIDFTMNRLHAVRVSGRLIDGATGMALPGARVMLRTKTEGWAGLSPITSVLSDINGNFELRRIAPGTNTLTATMVMPGQRQVSTLQDLQIGDKDVSGLQVVLQPTPSINGRVVFEGERREGSLRLMGNEGGTTLASGVTQDGSFVVPSIAPGVYRVALNFPDGFFVRSARSGSRDVLRDGIDVTNGPTDPIEIRVASSAGALQGMVSDQDNKPVIGAQVVLIPNAERHERPDLFKNAPTDQLGRFTIRSITPGDYTLFAWEDIEPGAWFDAQFLQPYGALGTPVHVDDGASLSLNLKVIP